MTSDKMEDKRARTEAHIEKLQMYMKNGGRTLDPFVQMLHIEMLHANEEEAEGILHVTDKVLNPFGMVHGGCISSLADTVAGHHIASTGRLCVTLNCTMNFLKPAMGEWLRCRSKIKKLGKTVSTLELEVIDPKDELIGMATFTFYKMKDIEPHIIQRLE